MTNILALPLAILGAIFSVFVFVIVLASGVGVIIILGGILAALLFVGKALFLALL